jgi:hypothetical protein
MAFTYIVRCSDGSELVWSAEFEHIGAAFAFEKQVQGWSRSKREALIRGDFDALPELASRPTARREPWGGWSRGSGPAALTPQPPKIGG